MTALAQETANHPHESALPAKSSRMPVLFVGHGSPMNAIEDNTFSRSWRELGKQFAPAGNAPAGTAPASTPNAVAARGATPAGAANAAARPAAPAAVPGATPAAAPEYPRPKAILMISAHWFTGGSLIMANERPGMIYDMYGFPRPLYEIEYPAAGAPELAETIHQLLTKPDAQTGRAAAPGARLSTSWGFDHGGWSVLVHLFPDADIPALQLSVDRTAAPSEKFAIGQALKPLRDQGVFIIGSGNIVHNLGLVQFGLEGGKPWADAFDIAIKEAIIQRRFGDVVDYHTITSKQMPAATVATTTSSPARLATATDRLATATDRLAVPTTDHFDPLLYVLGAADDQDPIAVFNEARIYGSLSMTSYLIG